MSFWAQTFAMYEKLRASKLNSFVTAINSHNHDTAYYTQGQVNGLIVSSVPAGAVFQWTTDTAPTGGWLLCDGTAVSRSTYSGLFAVVGTTYGVGDDSLTFNVPDMRGRIPLGKDNMGGSSANRVTNVQADTIGGSEGAETHTLIIAEMPAHTHSMVTKTGGTQEGSDAFSHYGGSTGSTGGGGAHNNMQPYLTTNYIIKT